MTLIAALPMYDPPELEAANDTLWTAIADRLAARGVVGAPERLTRGAPLDAVWSDPGLLLGQTCGYPLMTSLRDKVMVVATPHYLAPGCEGPFCRSAVIVRQDSPAASLADLRGARCAVNDLASNSGMNLLRALIAPLAGGEAFFGALTVTGAHAASVERVADGEADVAAIDCVTWAHLQRHHPAMAKRVRVLTWTAASPGLPMITAAAIGAATLAALRDALGDVARDPSLRALRAELLLDTFSGPPASLYGAVLDLERSAVGQGYPSLQ